MEDILSKESLKKTLNDKFGLQSFRPKQKKIIRGILSGKDVCAIMFTGAGKSLCYQFPPVHTNKTAIVISPLISLMNDQTMKLEAIGIPSVSLNSSISKKKQIIKGIMSNKYRIVYATPEFITARKEFIGELYETGHLLMVAIDEAHCVSSWGHDFRDSYRDLYFIKNSIPALPLMALTATATIKTSNDIITSLKLDPIYVKTTFDRPNLNINVIPRSDGKLNINDIFVHMKLDEPTIIYCQTRDMTEEISSQLSKDKGVKCDAYHGGMDTTNREYVQRLFIDNEITCIVATVAFGMGIDKTIRKVIHYGVPVFLEDYYQEIGRAGRDGEPSECILLYSISDFDISTYKIGQTKDDAYRNHQSKLVRKTRKYIHSDECRRKIILDYFGESYENDNCGNCDNCRDKANGIVRRFDFSSHVMLVLLTIEGLPCPFGAGTIVKVLLGSKAKAIKPEFRTIKSYGKGKNHSEKWWKILLKMIGNIEFIEDIVSATQRGATVAMTLKGKKWLRENKSSSKLLKSEHQKLIMSIPKDMARM